MTTRPSRQPVRRAAPVHGLALGWGAALLALGAFGLEAAPRVAAMAAGAGCLGLAVAGFASSSWMLSVFGALGATSLGAIGVGATGDMVPVAAAGLVGLMIASAGAAICWQLEELKARPGRRGESATGVTDEILRQIHEHVLLSDTAKRVLFRDRELQLLRRAINEQMQAGDYDAAATLCDDMAELFGRREEAEQFRERILHVRREHDEARIMEALARLDACLASRNWAQAHQEAARMKRLYPESHLLQDIDQRIDRARAEHKHDLEREFVAAAERDDTEAAMGLLRELDRYLSRDEAERLATMAERVVTRRRDHLGEAFKLAVNQRRWSDAARLGDSIIAEFPRSRMSEEVRVMIDAIRSRAGGAPVASEGSI